MPRQSSGPKLWFDEAREKWTIVDGKAKRRTGCSRDEAVEAQQALSAYIAEKYEPEKEGPLLLGDVFLAYRQEVTVGQNQERVTRGRIIRLNAWWGDKTLSEVTVENCKAYIAYRHPRTTSARCELSVLRAALRHWHKNHNPILVPAITMPARSSARLRWLTRSEAAAFLWRARRTPHLARFFIIGWYSGSRRTVILDSRWSRVDFESRIMHRKNPGAVQTNKRAPPFKIGSRLLSHLRRWHRLDKRRDNMPDRDLIVWWAGDGDRRPMKQVDTSWHRARVAAGLSKDVTPHVLRHSRATHMMRQGVDVWEAAQFLGMTVQLLQTTYGHHRPDWQTNAADAR